MKKKFTIFLAALLIAGTGTAFAEGNDSSFDAGITYGVLSYINNSDDSEHIDISGIGFNIGKYKEWMTFFGMQTDLFVILPRKCMATYGGTSIDLSDSYSSPFLFTIDALVMLNLPLGNFDFRVGAGLSYTMHSERDYVSSTRFTSYYNHYIGVPIAGEIIFNSGTCGIKIGLNANIMFGSYRTSDSGTSNTYDDNYTQLLFYPKVTAVFKM